MLPLIDTHQHLFYHDRVRYPWTGDLPRFQRSYTLVDYERDAQGGAVAATLFMEGDAHPEDAWLEAASIVKLESLLLRGVVASARPEQVDFRLQLEQLQGPWLKGIRRVLHVEDDALSTTPVFRRNLTLLGQLCLPFDLCLLPRQHHLGLWLVDACPETLFILDHCGVPNLSDPQGFASWRASLHAFSRRSNVIVKLSGMAASSPLHPVTLDLVRPYLDSSLEAFGADRCLWGSDWPICTLTTPLIVWIHIFRAWLCELSDGEQSAIAHRTARRIYQLENLPL